VIRHLEAVYQNGVLRPLEPIDLRENQRVMVTVSDSAEDLLLDVDYLHLCGEQIDESVTLEAVRQALAKIPGSMTADFIAEREDRE
jgi:predicted DNA-binding antitoxin AbrB/MazE fold protein